MTEIWVWGLIASLILLAIGTTLKSAHDTFLLKQSDKEIARLLSEVETLQKAQNKTVPRIEKSNSAGIDKFSDAQSENLLEETAEPTITQRHSGIGDNVGGDKTTNNTYLAPDALLINDNNGIRTVEKICSVTGVSSIESVSLSSRRT